VSGAVSLTDVAPTLLSLAGAPLPATMYGQDVLAKQAHAGSRTRFAENSMVKGDADTVQLGITSRQGDAKLIIGPAGRRCFDLAGDPGENAPRSAGSHCGEQRYEEVQRWRREMQALGESLGEVGTYPLSAERQEQLRELGYLE
jgi:arylsulfatase A-like enzyme